jgi:hypothetical protein
VVIDAIETRHGCGQDVSLWGVHEPVTHDLHRGAHSGQSIAQLVRKLTRCLTNVGCLLEGQLASRHSPWSPLVRHVSP